MCSGLRQASLKPRSPDQCLVTNQHHTNRGITPTVDWLVQGNAYLTCAAYTFASQMTAKAPINIPEITWTLVAKNIDASEVTVVHSRFVNGQRKILAQVSATP